MCYFSHLCIVSVPVALAYTTLARGSWFCRSSTALPILVDVAFLALWHSSKMICWGHEIKDNSTDSEKQFALEKPRHMLVKMKGYNAIKVWLAPV